MAISRLCHHNFSIRVMILASVFLLSLANGVSSERPDDGYSRSDQDTDILELGFPSVDQPLWVNYLQDLIQKSQMKKNLQFPGFNNGEDSSRSLLKDKEKHRFSLLKRMRNMLHEKSGTGNWETKRRVSIGVCNFKVCNYG